MTFEKEFSVKPSEFYAKTKEAAARIKDHILQTPLELSDSLSQGNNSQVYLKMEHLQITGSFKIRGATLSIASFMNIRQIFKDKKIVLILTGKRIGFNTLTKLLCQGV